MSTLKTINVIHPSGTVNNIVNDASGNVTIGNNLTVTGSTTIGSLVAPVVAGGSTASSTLTLESTTGAGTSDSILFKTGSQSTRMSIDTSGNVGIASGNLTFSGTGQRITGDFSNATLANRLSLQTSTTNGNTTLSVIPNGTGNASGIAFYNALDAANSGFLSQYVSSTSVVFNSAKNGTGSALPLVFQTSTIEAMRIDTSQNVGIGTSSPGYKLEVGGGTGTQVIRINGAGSGTAGGSAVYFGQGGSNNLAIGNYSAIIGGAFDATSYIYNTGAFGIKTAAGTGYNMYLDTNGNLGLGQTSINSQTRLAVAGASTIIDARGIFSVNSTNAAAANLGGSISLGGENGQATTPYVFAGISGRYEGSGYSGYMVLSTTSSVGTVTERMRIDSSGNVGIGTSSPSYKLDVSGQRIRINNASDPGIEFWNGSVVKGYVFYDTTNNLMTMRHTTTSTGAAIDSSGNLLVGTTTQLGSATFTLVGSLGAYFRANGGAGNEPLNCHNTATSGTIYQITFRDGASATSRGSITTNGTGTTYGTASDYRLKENVLPMNNGLATVAALKPVTYDWIGNKSHGEGFIAHELAEVIPQAVTGEKDAVDDEGNIVPQGVDYSKIVVHLVAAIKELSAKNDALEARLAALEGTK